MSLLKVRNLHCRHSGRSLRGLEFTLEAGEIHALLGAAGAGKTTLLGCLSGLLPVTGGEIVFAGMPLRRCRPEEIVRAGISQVPQGQRIFPGLTVWENLKMGAWCRSDRSAVARDMERVCELFPLLAEQWESPGRSLAPDGRQMLALGRALLARPRLLLLDEPSRELTPIQVKRSFAILERIAAEGVAILLAERNFDAALTLADYGYLMAAGQSVQRGPAGEMVKFARSWDRTEANRI